jgi:polyisoprenoid-binding protein YceI
MKRYLVTCAVLALAACSPKTPAPAKTEAVSTPAPAAAVAATDVDAGVTVPPNTAPAGAYKLDPEHTNVSFRVSHLGFSHYTANFDKVAGALQFDPAKPQAMTVDVTIDPKSLDLNAPPAGFVDHIVGKDFLDAAAFPTITFKSTKIETTGPKTANVTGDLTLHGVTKPVTLATTFNGGYAANAFDGARIGFSATGVLKRSDFGIASGVPAPGTNMGVGDNVVFTIETEFSNGGPVKAATPTPG